MKQTTKRIVCLVAFLGVGSIPVFGKPFAKVPYLGQTPPGPIAQVFAPGLISDTRPRTWEAFGTFSADGNTSCFQGVGGIFITENTDQGVDLTNVNTIGIGFGDRNNPQAGSSGLMYFDDIRLYLPR